MRSKIVEKLLTYASIHLGMDLLNKNYLRNRLLHLLNLSECEEITAAEVEEIKSYDLPDPLIYELNDFFRHTQDLNDLEREERVVEIMGIITPLPSEVVHTFETLKATNPSSALTYLYQLGIKNDYIKKSAIDKNLEWDATFKVGSPLKITINLSKPEKDNKETAKLVTMVNTSYPKCVLCPENEGFYGNEKRAARTSIRLIPLHLDNELWYFQFSPYGYYNEHSIIIKSIHENMVINKNNMSKLLAFVDQFPSYFVGSNSDLPYVGGSILNHEHFQSGSTSFPMMEASKKYEITIPQFKTKISYLDFYNSTFLLESTSKVEILETAEYIRSHYAFYNDPTISLLSSEGSIQHSTITPIVKKVGNLYKFYIILRNNMTSDEYKEGIFHAHPEFHNIKKESIGLIEAMGLFILPARLKRQTAEMSKLLSSPFLNSEGYYELHPDMYIHRDAISKLIEENPGNYTEIEGQTIVKEYINQTCRSILENTAIFKNDDHLKENLQRFVTYLGGKIL